MIVQDIEKQADLVVKNSGLVYRNPKPHVRSKQAYFPSVAALSDGEMLCSFVIGEAFESADCRLYLSRSYDYGNTWELESRLVPEDDSLSYSESGRITALSDGSLVAVVFRYDRQRADEGLANAETLGFVETEIYLMRSFDKGRTWSDLKKMHAPVVGPEFELCSPIVELRNGDWLLPTSTWRAWDGYAPNGMKAVAFLSEDQGCTWSEYVDVLNGTAADIIHWEQKIVELEAGRLISVAWAYDEKSARDLPNVYSISTDGGSSFSETMDTGLLGQTPAILRVSRDRLLCVYRRIDIPGLWGADILLDGDRWITERQTLLWGAPDISMGGSSANMVKNFNVLRFGAPCVTRLQNGDVYVAFWCVEDSISNVRWIRISI